MQRFDPETYWAHMTSGPMDVTNSLFGQEIDPRPC